jgi:hypothetical protein
MTVILASEYIDISSWDIMYSVIFFFVPVMNLNVFERMLLVLNRVIAIVFLWRDCVNPR